jgi:hydrogenase maturation protease
LSRQERDGALEALVLGIGNVLWADEGFGVRAVERLERDFEAPPGVKVLDGGTQGLYLVPFVQRAKRLLVFDAIDYGDAPGALRVIRDAEVPKFGGAKKMSLHQTGFQEVLELAELLGHLPEAITLVGIQAAVLEDFGGSLSPEVDARLDEALALGCAELDAWGLSLNRRAAALAEGSTQVGSALARWAYEAGRPSEQVAFRGGDIRFLGGA